MSQINHIQLLFKVHKEKDASVYATVQSAHPQSWNAVRLWNRCCCNSGKTRSLNTYYNALLVHCLKMK